MLKRSLQICESALHQTQAVPGRSVNYAESSNTARQWIGNIGYDDGQRPVATTVTVGRLVAKDNSTQGFGSISGEAAKDFFKR